MKDLDRISRKLIRALRHAPESINIELDTKGWTNVNSVLKSLGINKEELDIIVKTNNKKRFEYNTNHTKIRASQGHSLKNLDIQNEWSIFIPSSELYHGTSYDKVNIILKDSIKPMNRTHVHLSKDKDTAKNVGSRHGSPVILLIDAVSMYSDGFKFYESNNGVILADIVPSKYIKIS